VRGKGKKSNNADPGYFVNDAEELTGITQQQVSKWAKKLEDPEKYRAALFGKTYQQAMNASIGRHVLILGNGCGRFAMINCGKAVITVLKTTAPSDGVIENHTDTYL
jgi:hypothetical protein